MALLLVVLGGAVLAWRQRYPRLVVCVATAATVAYSLPGYENGVALLLPAIGLVTIATRSPVRHSVVWALAVTIVLMAATAANNPTGPVQRRFLAYPGERRGGPVRRDRHRQPDVRAFRPHPGGEAGRA